MCFKQDNNAVSLPFIKSTSLSTAQKYSRNFLILKLMDRLSADWNDLKTEERKYFCHENCNNAAVKLTQPEIFFF